MKQTDFAKALTDFLGHYLTIERGYSTNTVITYSYTFTLFIEYMDKEELVKPDKLNFDTITKERILGFLSWIENKRECSVSTRNARFAALCSFFKYLQFRNVAKLAKWQEILSIKAKKEQQKEMAYLSMDGIKLLLKQPDTKTRKGRRDFVLLGLLYDSGCRVQELIDLTPASFRFDEITTVRLHGKGNKIRIIPLSATQVANLRQYMHEEKLETPECQSCPLFPNPRGEKLSRMAVLNIVKKYHRMAREINREDIPERIGCHSLRHTKAMHMLEADINLVYIRDFLGHTSTTTTEVYARASDKMKQKALSKLNPGIIDENPTSWQKDHQLLSYLKDLQKKY